MIPLSPSIMSWLIPAITALILYGIGQGLVKKWISQVAPARFCLYFIAAKTIVNLGYFFTNEHPPLSDPAGLNFIGVGILAYILDGAGWIFYFKSIVKGPITIVGTLSAAYPALTVIFARIFLDEALMSIQYAGVSCVIAGCMGLSYSSPDPNGKKTEKTWIPLAFFALLLWAAAQTIVKYSYGLPNASESTLALCNTIGGALTLGTYGLLYGRQGVHRAREWVQSFLSAFLPMGMLAAGDLGVIIATKYGPISIVTPVTGAYPLVTLGFASVVLKEKITKLQWLCIVFILVGIYLSPGSS